ncbi:MAG: hypothetical protein LC790_00460 [Actinobacteria bacterium]|nr:hypothetical protein [Actinomycetota bacterium]
MRGSALCHAHGGQAVGRPTLLSDELEQKLTDALRAGNYLSVAAAYAGVSRSTVHRWLALAEEENPDPRLVHLRDEVRKAEAAAEVHAVAVMRKASAAGEWRAAATFLERRYPERWRRREPPGSPAGAQHDQQTDIDAADPESRRLLSALLKRRTNAR